MINNLAMIYRHHRVKQKETSDTSDKKERREIMCVCEREKERKRQTES